LKEIYKNEYWTQIVTLQSDEDIMIERFPLAQNLIETQSALEEMDEHQGVQVFFDPFAFVEANPAPS